MEYVNLFFLPPSIELLPQSHKKILLLTKCVI